MMNRPKATAADQMMEVWNKVAGAKDGKRDRAELFMELPERVDLGQPVFPPVMKTAPVKYIGRVDKMENGELPNMSKNLPDEEELRTWTQDSQEAFWSQRRAFWNRMKLSEMQRESRKRGLWPGGDQAFVKDRLLRHDFCRSTLGAQWEKRSEEQDTEERSQIGVVYYDIIKDPIDLNTIQEKIKVKKYRGMQDFEEDMKLLFSNARSFDAEMNAPEDQVVSRDADALEKILTTWVGKLAPTMAPAPPPDDDSDYDEAPPPPGSKNSRKRSVRASGRASKDSKSKKKAKEAPATRAALELGTTLTEIWEAISEVCDDEQRNRAELFMDLPDKVEMRQPVFPQPLTKVPALERTGRADKMEDGALPDMNEDLPDEEERLKWNRESQLALWAQRRAFWNRLKLSELQRECRKRMLFPGGDVAFVRDRLLRYEHT